MSNLDNCGQHLIETEEMRRRKSKMEVTDTYGLPNFGGKSQLEYDDMSKAIETLNLLPKFQHNEKQKTQN